jgi:hypothetical protein
MPMRGRDTYYLEHCIALADVGMGVVITLVTPTWGSRQCWVFQSYGIPWQFWSIIWMGTAAVMLYGCIKHNRKCIEWASLMGLACWMVVAWRAYQLPYAFPVAVALSPMLIYANLIVFLYQLRVSAHLRSMKPNAGIS